jgi:hypothetical protein
MPDTAAGAAVLLCQPIARLVNARNITLVMKIERSPEQKLLQRQ